MKKDRPKTKSRRITPWTGIHDATPMQAFIEECTRIEYESKHPTLKGSPEVALINSFVPKACPHCGSDGYRKKGFTSNGVQRFVCNSCGRSFCALTGTGFDRSRMQGYLDLFCFITNPPHNKYEKLEKLLTLAIRNPRLLRYRG